MYSALAKFYEKLNDNCDRETWSHYLISLLGELCGDPGKLEGADLGCGTGGLTALLARETRIAAACDLSAEMLSAASARAGLSGVPLVQCDFSQFRAPHKLNFLNAADDAFNYLPPAELKKTFARLRAQLKGDGVLLFDLSSPYKLREVLGDNLFFDDGEELSMFWQSELCKSAVKFSLTFFERTESGLYRRTEEEQTQYIHEPAEVLQALAEAGFSERVAYDGFTRAPVRPDSLRIQFAARR